MSPDRATAFMLHAVELAKRGRRHTAPNPSVGALLVCDGEIVAEGWHQRFGGPHAEIECLANAKARGVDPAQCAMFVTLEPCNHHGKTPPCSRAVLAAGVRELYVGTLDPNPVAKGGAQFLRENGVAVHVGVAESACRDLIADFRVWKATERPYVILKMAATLDGKIATRTGHSQWVSGEASRRSVHELRSRVDAVIVGGGTFRADNPGLDARPQNAPDALRQPLAVVVTATLPAADADFQLLARRASETIFWTTQDAADGLQADALRTLGCRVWGLPSSGDGLDLAKGLEKLRSDCGCLRALCEGGGGLALSFLASGLIDEFRLFVAPKILGDEMARNLFTGRSPLTMDEAIALRTAETRQCGEDTLIIYRREAD
ncbi:bifunctional diaminohydroxyphosphoribosylaminopyrimidine deaminase/5-amino-6-(5-phosphoribosylamino)uracil reductase RibD [Desulfobaculum xiamenense]|uniref:bifunctional diaminohydroxyphosphoribosylaminopyrimidine deaminase/5-amino-6-(5-phosphoribosylamino)uracil reductase RibD n=1 Tax=Desulfobaculum xiamenense TaxID=995050 RepID=UPI001439E9B2